MHRFVLARKAVTGTSTHVTWLDDPCPAQAGWSWIECNQCNQEG
jgi:hypothetical protein